MIDILKPLIQQFMPFAQQQMGFSRPPRLFLRQDQQNADNPMGKTGFYDPGAESITLYTTGRHPKDIMRSLAHELMHHTQKCNGDFENVQNMGEQGYAQADPHMRNMEIEAYQASIVFRDWEDSTKGTIYYEHLQKGDNVSMSTKKWKNGELKSLLAESWGFKMNLGKLTEYSASGVKRGPGDDGDEDEAKKETEGKEDSKREEEGLEEASSTDRPDRARKEGGRRVDEDGCGMDHGHEDEMAMIAIDDEEPDAEGLANQLLSVAQQIADMLGQGSDVLSMADGEEELVGEESWPGKRDADQHKSDLSEAHIRRIVRKVLKETKKKGS